MSMFRHKGARTRRLLSFLEEREKAPAESRRDLDREAYRRLFRPRCIVFTDTADFTVRTAADGILHFLMIFDRAVRVLTPVIAEAGGDVVKVEADSLMLRFPDPNAALRAVDGMERTLRDLGRERPKNEHLRFSYGVGYGELLDLDGDLFGLEVNLASKLGEDMAEPGEVLLTPAAAAALEPALLKRVVAHRIVTFEKTAIPVQRFKQKR